MTAERRVINSGENIAGSSAYVREMPPAARAFACVAGLALLAAGLYLAPTTSTLALAALGLGLPLLMLIWSRPEFGLLATIFLTSGFVPADIVDLRLPIGGGLDLRDLALIGMLGLLAFQGLVRKRLSVPWPPVGIPLLLFLAGAVLSAFYALFYHEVEANWALGDLRIFLFYTVFFVAGWTLRQRRQLATVIAGLFVITDLTAAVILIQQFYPEQAVLSGMLYSHWNLRRQAAVSSGVGAVRIVPPGHALMYFMMVIAFSLMLCERQSRRKRAVFVLQFAYLNVGLLLTYTRAQWIAAALALGLIVAVLVWGYRTRLARYLVIGIAVLVLALSLYGLSGTDLQEGTNVPPLVSALTARALSIFTVRETLESDSLEWRLFESEEALRSISKHPVLGVGLGNRYRNVTTLLGEARGLWARSLAAGEVSRFTRYVHSSYLSMAVKMGLPTLIIFLWFCAAFLVRGWQLYATLSESHLRGLVLAVVAASVGLLAWSAFHSHLVEAEGAATFGVVTGLVAAVAHAPANTLGSLSMSERLPS